MSRILDRYYLLPLAFASGLLLSLYFSHNFFNCHIERDTFDSSLYFGFGSMTVFALLSSKLPVPKINYFSLLILRLVFIFILFKSIYFQFLVDRVPDIEMVALQDKILKDISPNELQNYIYDKLPALWNSIGLLSILSLILLLTQRTSPVGFLLSIPVFILPNLISSAFSCSYEGNSTLALLASIASVPFLFRIYNLILGRINEPISHPVFEENHFYYTGTFLKYISLLGFFVLFSNKPNKFYHYYAHNADSPIKGVWTIQDVDLEVNPNRDYQSDTLFQADRIYLSSSRYGKIKVNDTISTFEYMVDPSNNQFELFNFYDYRKIDLKGKFEVLSDKEIRFNGKNEKDKISFTLVLEDGYEVK